MRDMQKKMLEWIETSVTAYNGSGAALELLVNYSRENSGEIYVQPAGCFLNVIECSFIFETSSRYSISGKSRCRWSTRSLRPSCGSSIVFD
jgi:hypothetical protein